MRKSIVVAIAAAGSMLVVSGSSLACGESVFRVGKGVQYRAFSAPIPGSVLVYARTDNEREVAENLRSAGHSVAVVSSDEELAHELQSQTFDVVVAHYSMRDVVEEQAAQIASRPDWLPIVDDGNTPQLRWSLGRWLAHQFDLNGTLDFGAGDGTVVAGEGAVIDWSGAFDAN